jgi:hypothetical protein
VSFVDPDGQWVHIVVGAVIGGVVNLGVKAFQGKINSWGDGIAAFGIGAAAGAVTAATGGAAASAMGLSSTGVLSGAVTGTVGSAVGDPIRGLGNSIYFGDSYTLKDYGSGILMSGAVGGVAGGAGALIKGNNFWSGSPQALRTSPFSFNNEKLLREQGNWIKVKGGKWVNTTPGELTFGGADLGDGVLRDFGGLRIGDKYSSGIAAQVKGRLTLYPNVLDLRTGARIPMPQPTSIVPHSMRVQWNLNTRNEFIQQWHSRGYPTPKGGWGEYDIHHILPRQYGGTNDFWNLSPVLRSTHWREFNEFWRNFGNIR